MNRKTVFSLLLWGVTLVIIGYRKGPLLCLALVYGIAFHELGHACVHAIEGNFRGFRIDGMLIKSIGVKGKNVGAMYAGGLFLNFITFPVLFQMIPRDEWSLFVVTFVVGSAYDVYKFASHISGKGGKA